MTDFFALTDSTLLRQHCLIDGQWREAASGQRFEVHNPATGTVLAQVACASTDDARHAIDAAGRALPGWRTRTAGERSRILRRWFELLMQHQDDLARLMTLEQGKPLAEARGEIAYAANYLEWFAEEAKRAYGELIPPPASDRRLLVIRQPVGVCAAITPWNFPAAMITRKVAPALAAGCTMVVKPSELTPLSALALGELALRAGVPAGVLNIIMGDAPAIGAVLTASPVVRKLSFTGSTQVGRLLMAQCAPTIKKLSLELGGNAPFIVFDDADVDAAVEGALLSKYRNSGQTCVCTNRFLVQAGIHDLFAEKLARAVQKLRVGNGLDEGVVQGPLINRAALQKVDALVQDACKKGAVVLGGGKAHAPAAAAEGVDAGADAGADVDVDVDVDQPADGLWYCPTVLTGITPAMAIFHEEIFGPVAALTRFDTEGQAVQLANDTPFGLAAYLYSRDPARIWRVSEALECGMVGINTGLISSEVAPFGGIKQSGLGREGSRHGLDDYLELKYLAWAGVGGQG